MTVNVSSLTFDYSCWPYSELKKEQQNCMLLPRTSLLSPKTKQNRDNCNEATKLILLFSKGGQCLASG